MKPPFKYCGGKTRLLPNIRKYLPATCNNYFEPFVGGGALFFDYGYKAQKAYLNDINLALMLTYEAMAENVEKLIEDVKELKNFSYGTIRQTFNEVTVHAKENTCASLDEIPALFVALNKLCFNGIWRENKSGLMNVPQGKNSQGRPYIIETINFDNIREAGKALKNADIRVSSFNPWPFLAIPQEGDVWFADPPYIEEFSNYNSEGFNNSHHLALAKQAHDVAESGATVIVCGSNNKASHLIYGEPTEVIELKRNVGNSKRKMATEALYVYTKNNS